MSAPGGGKIRTAALVKRKAAGEKIVAVTAYDAAFARLADRAGVDVLLVGDTLGMVVQGHATTLPVTVDEIAYHCRAVARAAVRAHIVADMPFMSYQADEAEAIRNAGRFMTQGLADVVKVEADASFAPLVAKMTRAGIPVCAHVGSKPQQAALFGGYGAAGRTAQEAERIVADAVSLEQAGAVMLLIEAVPDEVTRRVLESTRVPLIGIGAGTECHGQVLVLQDLLGLTDAAPRFAQPVANMGPAIQQAAAEWVSRVRVGRIGGRRYSMSKGEAQKLAWGNGANPPPKIEGT